MGPKRLAAAWCWAPGPQVGRGESFICMIGDGQCQEYQAAHDFATPPAAATGSPGGHDPQPPAGGMACPSVRLAAGVATASVPVKSVQPPAAPGFARLRTSVNPPSPRPTCTGVRTAFPPSTRKHTVASPCLTTA